MIAFVLRLFGQKSDAVRTASDERPPTAPQTPYTPIPATGRTGPRPEGY